MGRFFNDRGSSRRDERPMMHRATCDKCGKDCEVPFRPSGNKPVFCSRCFEKEPGGDRDRDRNNNNRRERRDFSSKSLFSAVCDECGKNCEVPFKPSSDKPIYCSKCFENVDPKRREPRSEKTFDMAPLQEELKAMNSKLDDLIALLQPVEKKAKAVSKTKAIAKPKAKAKKTKEK